MAVHPPRTRLLRPWVPPDNPAVRRLIIAGAAGILLTAPLSVSQLIRVSPLVACLLTAAGGVLGVRCCSWAWKPSSAATLAATLGCMVFATATLTEGISQVSSALEQTDAQLLCIDDVSPSVVGGGQAVVHGSNPYTAFDVLRAERALGCPSFHVSATRSGIFAGRNAPPSTGELDAVASRTLGGQAIGGLVLRFSYPAGSALIGIAGAHGVVVLNVLFLLVGGVALVWLSPRATRHWVALAIAAQTAALIFIGEGHPDGVAAVLLVVACSRREPLVGGVALGMACAIKQRRGSSRPRF